MGEMREGMKEGFRVLTEETNLRAQNVGTVLRAQNEGTGLRAQNEGTGLRIQNKGTESRAQNEGSGLRALNEGMVLRALNEGPCCWNVYSRPLFRGKQQYINRESICQLLVELETVLSMQRKPFCFLSFFLLFSNI
jgi:hypothetical protein